MLSHLPGEHFLFYAVRDIAGFPGRYCEIVETIRDIAGFPGRNPDKLMATCHLSAK